MVAADLGLDPAELRRRNLIDASEMPYNVGPTRLDGRDTVYDSGDYASAFDRALEQIGYGELSSRRGPDDLGRYHGVGIASYVEPTGFGPFEGARVLITQEGGIEVYLGITTMGQGHETVMAQICADSLSVLMDDVRVFHGSTDYIPASIGTFGSRATVMAGSAIHLSCQTLRARILSLSASYLDTTPEALDLRHGVVVAKDSTLDQRQLTLQQVAALAESQRQFDDPDTALDATEYFRIEEWTYSYGSHAAHVAVDPETGKLEVLRYVVVEDVGRCINPLTMHGQSVGGAAQGIGGNFVGGTCIRRCRSAGLRHPDGLPAAHQHRHPGHRDRDNGGCPIAPEPTGRKGRRRGSHTGHGCRPRKRLGQRALSIRSACEQHAAQP